MIKNERYEGKKGERESEKNERKKGGISKKCRNKRRNEREEVTRVKGRK